MQDAVLSACANRGHDHLALLRIHFSGGHACCDRTHLHELLLCHAFATVTQQGMGNLVTHHDGETIVILGHRNNARIDRDLATGQTERVDLIGLDQAYLPLVGTPVRIRRGTFRISQIFFDFRCSLDQTLGNALHFLWQFTRSDDLGLLQDLLIGLQAKRGFLLSRGIQQLLAPGKRRRIAVTEIVVAKVRAEQEDWP